MSTLEVYQVRYAERTAIKSKVFHDYAQHGQPDSQFAMDYNFWFVRDGDQVILIDTGYDPAESAWLGERSTMPVPEALKRLHIDPAKVPLVVLSHYHFDHIGFVNLFPNARIVAGRAEHEHWLGLWRTHGVEDEFADPRHLAVMEQVEAEGRLELVDEPTEVWPGIIVHPIAGHCPGQLLALVHSASGPRIIASDVAHFYEQVEHGWVFFVFSDINDMIRSFRELRTLAESVGAEVIPGHDARVRERYPVVEGAEEFANRLG